MMDVKKACEIIRKNKAEGFQQERGEALMVVVDAIQEGYELQLPKVGRWIPHDKFEYECSECGYTFIADDTDIDNYCAYCGAYNQEGDADEE